MKLFLIFTNVIYFSFCAMTEKDFYKHGVQLLKKMPVEEGKLKYQLFDLHIYQKASEFAFGCSIKKYVIAYFFKHLFFPGYKECWKCCTVGIAFCIETLGNISQQWKP